MKKKGNILVIDDNEEILFSLEVLLSNHFENIKTLNSPNKIPSLLQKQNFDVYILDMNFSAEIQSGNEGFYWMNEILKYDPEAIIIFITAFAGIELAVKAIKNGATDFVEKPWDNRKLLTTIINAYELRRSKNEIKILEEKQHQFLKEPNTKNEIIKGSSASIKEVYNIANKVSKTDANVLILGENGTGKEIIAREIHQSSKRSKKPFISIDMGAISETLFESELFGHKKGAFTDAKENRIGKLELASGGTLFLDEIGNLPVHLQSKLLTVIQNRILYKLGSNTPVEIDIRLISATNKNLNLEINNGNFREDLLYRLNTVQIEIPALKQRKADIKLFIDFFLDRFKKKYTKENIILSESAYKKLINYNWPGNIRQLKHTIENIVILSENKIISSAEINLKKPIKKSHSDNQINYYENEKEHVQYVLDKNKGHLSKTAKELGIARTTLYRKIEKYGL